MGISDQESSEEYELSSDGDYSDNDESDSDYGSEDDPSYDVLEDSRSILSTLSIKKKGKSRVSGDSDSGDEVEPMEVEVELNENDRKSLETVQEIIKTEKLENLKLDQCKVYLRKNGLRLTGNKGTLLQRIKEHQEIINGGGEKKYPPSSFTVNCKGDACIGDVVMFQQNVYDLFNIVSRSANGPPCGKRTVAGRIIKESYGAAKQQHTFTIEVLWSKGEKGLPPLKPLLIKGRNLYRFNTMRQRWENEGERQKFLMEKHSRGSLARIDREARIQEKERKKALRASRSARKGKPKKNQSSNARTDSGAGTLGSCIANSSQPAILPVPVGASVYCGRTTKMSQPSRLVGTGKSASHSQRHVISNVQGKLVAQYFGNQNQMQNYNQKPNIIFVEEKPPGDPFQQHHGITQILGRSMNINMMTRGRESISHCPVNSVYGRNDILQHIYAGKFADPTFGLKLNENRHPLETVNHQARPPSWGQQGGPRQQICRHFDKGRCHYGDNCKFMHDYRRENVQRMEPRR